MKILKAIWDFLYLVLMYIYYMLDRFTLVPFLMYSSPSVFELAEVDENGKFKHAHNIGGSIIRVSILLVAVASIIIVRWIWW